MYCDVFCLFLSCFYPWALVSIRTHYMLPKRAVVSLDVVSSDLCYTAHSSQISKLLPQCSDFRSDELTIHVDFKSKCQWQKHTVASLERSVSRFVVCNLSVPNEMWTTISPIWRCVLILHIDTSLRLDKTLLSSHLCPGKWSFLIIHDNWISLIFAWIEISGPGTGDASTNHQLTYSESIPSSISLESEKLQVRPERLTSGIVSAFLLRVWSRFRFSLAWELDLLHLQQFR